MNNKHEAGSGGPFEDKDTNLGQYRRHPDERLTTAQGVPVEHTDDSLKAGERGLP